MQVLEIDPPEQEMISYSAVQTVFKQKMKYSNPVTGEIVSLMICMSIILNIKCILFVRLCETKVCSTICSNNARGSEWLHSW